MAKSEYIYKTMRIQKKDYFNTIITLLKNAGWVDLEPANNNRFTMQSTGVNGDRLITIQFTPSYTRGYSSSYDIRTTAYTYFYVELVKEYNPTTFSPIKSHSLAFPSWGVGYSSSNSSTQIPMDNDMTLLYYADKNQICLIAMPDQYTAGPNFANFWGAMDDDSYYMDENLAPFSGTLALSTNNFSYTPAAYMQERPNGLSERITSLMGMSSTYYHFVSGYLPPISPNANGYLQLNDMFVQKSDEGTRCKIDGIYNMTPGGLLTGDIIEIDGKQYYAVILMNSNSSFPATYIAVRIS